MLGENNRAYGYSKMAMLMFAVVAMFFTPVAMNGTHANKLMPERDLNAGLVAYWNFDEGSGNVLHDVSGHGNDGTIYGATWVDGVHGKALSFNGNEDYVKINSNLLNQLPLTISGWVKPEVRSDYGYTTQFPNNVISNDYPGSSGMGFGVNMWRHNTMITVEYQGHIGEKASFVRITNVSFVQSTWHFVVVTYTIGNFWLYVDGKEIYHLNFTQEALDGVNYIRIGKHNDDSYRYATTRFFKGAVDELRIYNRALSANEIKELYYMYAPKAPQSLSGMAKSDGIHLEWHAPANADIVLVSEYDIYRSNDGTHFVKIATVHDSTYQDHDVVKGAKYYYYVVAKTSSGVMGDKSQIVSVKYTVPAQSQSSGGSNGGNNGLPPLLLWSIIGAIAAAVVIIAVVLLLKKKKQPPYGAQSGVQGNQQYFPQEQNYSPPQQGNDGADEWS